MGQDFLVAWVCLHQNPVVRPAQDAVEDPELWQVAGVAAKLAYDLYQKGRLHALLDPSELVLWANKHKVVSVHHAAEISLGVLEAAGAGVAPSEAHCGELRCKVGLPTCWGVACAVQAAVEPGTHAWNLLLWWQVDINQAVCHGVEVCLAGVDHQHLSAATAAVSALGSA